MIKFGTISKIDPDNGLVKVSFPSDDIESDWLPMIKQGTKSNKYFHIFDTGEHVACMMDERCENGVVLGAIYSKDETPGAVKGADVVGVEFSDGTVVKYDRSNSKLTIITEGNVEIEATKLKVTGDLEVTGDVDVTGGISATGDLETNGDIKAPTGDVTAGPLGVSLLLHKHIGVTTGPGTSGTPVP
jgi:phage baseplate assembly protein V